MEWFLNNFTFIFCCSVLFFGVIANVCTMIKTRNIGMAIMFGLHGAQVGTILLTFILLIVTTINFMSA